MVLMWEEEAGELIKRLTGADKRTFHLIYTKTNIKPTKLNTQTNNPKIVQMSSLPPRAAATLLCVFSSVTHEIRPENN